MKDKLNYILENIDKIKQMIYEHKALQDISSELNIKGITLQRNLKKIGIYYNGLHSMGGKKLKKMSTYYTTDNKHYITSSNLCKKLIEEGIKKEECEICHNKLWNGEKIPLDLHHKDGNHNNNSLDNLLVICPNCHRIEHKKQNTNKKRKYKTIKKICKCCGKEFDAIHNQKYCSHKCAQLSSIKILASKKELIQDMLKLKTFTKIGKKYHVSEAAIRKRFKKLDLPFHKKELIQYISNYN